MGKAMGQSFGFARPGTSNYQQRPRIKGGAIFDAVLNSTPLLSVEVSQIVMGHRGSLIKSGRMGSRFADSEEPVMGFCLAVDGLPDQNGLRMPFILQVVRAA